DLRLITNIDHLNFRELAPGTQLGWLQDGAVLQLEVRDDNDRDVQERYFDVSDGRLLTVRPFMPSMFTLDERIIRQDCLGYLMERLLPE
ncbi:MAG TPA: peptidase M14, partial [Gammaproteobacteria bacterium]|nr:peptidase M14 [Gammaproteobacteria bacterium]